jgi:hypothetical protein
MSYRNSASRRRDVYSTHRPGSYIPRRRRESESAAVRMRGVDSAGRFVGLHDVDRAFDFFWQQPHRRGSAPIVRAEFEFGPRAHASLKHAGGRPCGLDFDTLRAIHQAYAAGCGESRAVLAERYGLHVSTIAFHLKNGGSASMKAALAATKAAAAA